MAHPPFFCHAASAPLFIPPRAYPSSTATSKWRKGRGGKNSATEVGEEEVPFVFFPSREREELGRKRRRKEVVAQVVANGKEKGRKLSFFLVRVLGRREKWREILFLLLFKAFAMIQRFEK